MAGFFDGFLKENRDKAEKFKNGRRLYYDSPDAGIKQMTDNARTERDFRIAAAKQWEKVKDKDGRNKAFDDPTYKELMEKARNA